jgi:hypothetical protein
MQLHYGIIPGMNQLKGKAHKGLEALRMVLGEVMPEKARKGALMPKYMAPIAGINYETMRSLLDGGLSFGNESNPFYRLVALNLSFATGVHHNIQGKWDCREITDLRGAPYTERTYRDWLNRGLAASQLDSPIFINAGTSDASETPSLTQRMTKQSGELAEIILALARVSGATYQCMAFQLIKQALVGVAEDLGLLAAVQAEAQAALRDVRVGLIDGSPAMLSDGTSVRLTKFDFMPWDATKPAISISRVGQVSAMPESKQLREFLDGWGNEGDASAVLDMAELEMEAAPLSPRPSDERAALEATRMALESARRGVERARRERHLADAARQKRAARAIEKIDPTP